MSSIPGRVELGVHGTSVLSRTLTKNINLYKVYMMPQELEKNDDVGIRTVAHELPAQRKSEKITRQDDVINMIIIRYAHKKMVSW